MKHKKIFFTIFSLLLFNKSYPKRYQLSSFQKTTKLTNAVIPRYSGGRFGDNILAFAHTLYFSLQNNYELYLIPFHYSDQLILDNTIQKYTSDIEKKFKQKMIVKPQNKISISQFQNTLFVIPYFPEAFIEYTKQQWPCFFIDWENEAFKNELRKLIAPKSKLNLIEPPQDMISVAVHLRKGGGYDDESKIQNSILMYKMPSDAYYINQIKNISILFDNAPMYVFLFTDDQDPQAIAKKYQEIIDTPTITFDFRRENQHDTNVLEDFFSLLNFDILIRPESNFSIMAEKLGDYILVATPLNSFQTQVESGSINIKKPLNILRYKI